MSLTVVSIPIGNYGDITLRAIETLKTSDAIVCEELKPARILLKKIGAEEGKDLFQLNEHSKPKDLEELVTLCSSKNVALVSDCGTPGFCDPGADLVNACYRQGIKVDGNPGPSSLAAFLSLCGERLDQFFFVGFLPAEKSVRAKRMTDLTKLNVPLIIMDTPYRLRSTVTELATIFSQGMNNSRRAIVGVDLTGPEQKIHRGLLADLAQKEWPKAPFVMAVI